MTLSKCLAIFITLFGLIAGYHHFVTTFASAEEMKQFKQETRATTTEIQRSQLVNQLFNLQLKFPESDRPELVRLEIMRLEEEIKKLDRRLEKLYKGVK